MGMSPWITKQDIAYSQAVAIREAGDYEGDDNSFWGLGGCGK